MSESCATAEPRRRPVDAGTEAAADHVDPRHDAIAHAVLYTREAEQRRMARDGMAKIPSTRKLRIVEG
jgi:hypothetical protein